MLLSTQTSNDGKITVKGAKFENGKTSSRSLTNNIGESSTSSWLVVKTTQPANSGRLGYRSHNSIKLEMSCTWSQDEENIGLSYPTLIIVYVTLMLGWKFMQRPYEYIVSLGCRAFRRQFLFALNGWLGVD